MSILDAFARLVGVRRDLAEDALHSETAARHVLSRRGIPSLIFRDGKESGD